MDSLFDAARQGDPEIETDESAQGEVARDEAAPDEAPARSALPLGDTHEPLVRAEVEASQTDGEAAQEDWQHDGETAPSRALTLTDIAPPRAGPGEALIRLAYRIGIPGHALATPFRRAEATRLLATVESPNTGERAAGIALRAGHFSVHGVKQPIAQVDFAGATRLAPGLERAVHTFSWLADLAASGPREQGLGVAERITKAWLVANAVPAKGPAWELEHAALRLLAWLVHAPLVLGGREEDTRPAMLAAIARTADWVEARAGRSGAGLAQVAAYAAVTAAGLLLPQGKPRRLCAEAGLVRALGALVAEDGGVLSRCPAAQVEAIRMLTDCIACYDAVEVEPPRALFTMREFLVPPLLAIRHGDGALGSWQGQPAIPAARIDATIAASGVRTRALDEPGHWGFQRIRAHGTIVQFDAGPPPRARQTRCGAASTLAFEMSDGDQRLIVNCGGSAIAGGQVPARIAQSLRTSAAHSTLVLDNANSTAVLLHGRLGRGVETVELERRRLANGGTRIEASHDGYAARFGLTHSRVLLLSGDGRELAGEDILVPAARRGKRGRLGFAIRFHLGRGIEAHLSQDQRGASLMMPGGGLWQFRLSADDGTGEETRLSREDSLWVDGEGRPHPIEQLVIEGLVSRGGGRFSWFFKKMG